MSGGGEASGGAGFEAVVVAGDPGSEGDMEVDAGGRGIKGLRGRAREGTEG